MTDGIPAKLNIVGAFDRINEHWFPHIAGRVNGQEIRLAKIEGDFEWHSHEGVDEAFYVVKGAFTMRFREKDIQLNAGDFIVVPAGVEHMPSADEECWIMMIENAGTSNTGSNQSNRTRRDLSEL